jgi:hypothetical protein
VERRRFMNPAQPQTLLIAVFLLYANAAIAFLYMVLAHSFPSYDFFPAVLSVAAGVGISNEKKWAYWLGIAVALLPFALRFYYLGNPLEQFPLFALMFQIALVGLLLHPQSRDYQRIWFK